MYLLDTNICIYAMNSRPREVLQRLAQVGPHAAAISSITAAELAFGAVKSDRPGTQAAMEVFLAQMPVLDWGASAVWSYARTRLLLERSGQRIGERDLFIAAHALALDRTLVTNNLREFTRVPGLRCENWVQTT